MTIYISVLTSLVLAFVFDFFFSEVKRFHPLVGFGTISNFIENKLNINNITKWLSRSLGLLAWCAVVLPVVLLAYFVDQSLAPYMYIHSLVAGIILYVAIGWQSLLQHAVNISNPLKQNNLPAAREAVSMIVSRDTQTLDEANIAKAATESVLENGGDAIFSAIFWFVVAGIPGVVLYRLANTLDAMWGYKTPQFLHFGWFAARTDDVLNFIPARLTALSYAIVGNTQLALQCWRRQGINWKSPNAGPVMAAGAGAINTSLGGTAQYQTKMQYRPDLGPEHSMGKSANADSIINACRLVNRALTLWLVTFTVAVLLSVLL